MRKFVNSIELNPVVHRRILIYSLLEWTEVQAPELETEFAIQASSLRKIKFIVNQKISADDKAYVEAINIIRNMCRLC